MSAIDGFAAAKWIVMVPDKPNCEIALPPGPHGRRAVFMFELRSRHSCLVEFVTDDGEMIPIGSGSHVMYTGAVVGFKALNIHVGRTEKGSAYDDFAYKAYYHGPQRLFETPDPTPLAISAQSVHKPDIRSYIEELVDRQVSMMKAKYGIDVDRDDLLEDVPDADFDWDSDELALDDFGPGHMLEDDPASPSPDRREANPEEKPGAVAPEPAPQPKGPPKAPAEPVQVDLEEAISAVDGREPGNTAT